MLYAVIPSAFVFLTLALMFGCRRRRSFADASHKAAACIICVLCLAALAVFINGSIAHLFRLSQTNYPSQTHLAQVDDR